MSLAALTFNEAAHVYRHAGQVVPSVTQILAPLANFEGIPADVLERKRRLGQAVHLACQFDDEGDLDEASITDDVRGYLEAYRRFRRETGARVVANERRVYHATLGYAGTLDRVLEIRARHWLTDLKTCIATPLAVGPQTAAYELAGGFDPAFPRIHYRAALRLAPDGRYQLDTLTSAHDWPAFLACLTLRNFREAHQ